MEQGRATLRAAVGFLLVVCSSSAALTACSQDIKTPFSGSDNTPIAPPGGTPWGNDPCDTQSQPSPSPSPAPSPSPSGTHGGTSGWCSWFPWFPGCSRSVGRVPPFVEGQVCAPHNTTYCQVDSNGNIISGDTINVQDGSPIQSIGGGCVQRPIRDVWAVTLNMPYMKPTKVDQYEPTARWDLVDHSQNIYLVFDIENIVNALGGIISVSWTVRWYHAVSYGTYENPLEVAINYQKVDGSSHVKILRGGYTLDRVTANITSFVMAEETEADDTSADDMRQATQIDLSKVREGEPDWSILTPEPPGPSSSRP